MPSVRAASMQDVSAVEVFKLSMLAEDLARVIESARQIATFMEYHNYAATMTVLQGAILFPCG